MKLKLQKVTLLLLTCLGLFSVSVYGQQTFDFSTANDTEGWSKSFNAEVSQAASTGTNGVLLVDSGDGGTDENNVTIKYTGILDSNDQLKLVMKNPTNATDIRIRIGDNTNPWINITTDLENSSSFVTYYVDFSGTGLFANDTGASVGEIHLQFRQASTVISDASGMIEIDEMSFTSTSQQPAAPTYTFTQYAGAEGLSGYSTSALTTRLKESTLWSDSAITGWRLENGGEYSFSKEQKYDGENSIKFASTSNSGYGGWIYLGRTQDAQPTAAKVTLGNANTHLAILNVYIESGTPGTLRNRIDTSGDLTNLDWDLSGLETGKWYRLAKEINPTIAHSGEVMSFNFQNPASGTLVAYVDGIEFLSEDNSEYITDTGAGNSWSLAASWPNDTEPLATQIVYLKNNFNIWTDGEVAKEVFVADGKNLRFRHNKSDLTTEKLHLNSSGTLALETPGCSLIVTDEFTGNNNITVTRTLTGVAGATNAWHAISAPVSGQTVANFMANHTLASGTSNTSNRGIASYNNATGSFSYYQDGYAGTDSFDTQAYFVKLAAAGNITFTGGYNSGDREFSISQGAGDHFNLIGNPTTAFIEVGSLFTNNNAADRLSLNTLYIWDPSTNTYQPKASVADSGFKIAPGQAFFMKAGPASNNKVVINTASQKHNNSADTFLKGEAKSEILLNISQGNLRNNTKLYYIKGATENFDDGYDSPIFSSHNYNLAIYSQIIENGKDMDLSLQSLPKTDLESSIVSLGLIAEANEEISFTASTVNLPSDLYVYLEDRQENIFTDLSLENSEYTVNLKEAINGTGRFYLHTKSTALSTDDVFLNSVAVYPSNGALQINGLKNGQTTVSLYNILGKQVLSKSFIASSTNRTIGLLGLNTGVYIVQLTTEEGSLSKKIVLE